MPSPDDPQASSNPEILAARGQVELAKAELESRLYQAGDSGRRALRRMAGKAKPALIVAAVVVGLVVVARVVRSRRRRSVWPHVVVEDHDSGKPSLVKVTLGAVIRGALRVVATRLTEQAVARLVAANAEHAEEREPGTAPTLR